MHLPIKSPLTVHNVTIISLVANFFEVSQLIRWEHDVIPCISGLDFVGEGFYIVAGLFAGRSKEVVTPQSIAAVFARAIGAKPPTFAEAAVPRRLSGE